MVTFLFCTKTICLGSDHKAKPKKRRAFLSGRALYVPHFSATAERRPIRWDPKAQSLKAYGEGRRCQKEAKPRKQRVRYGFR